MAFMALRHSKHAFSGICERVSLERLTSWACRECLTPSPHVTGVLTISLARSDHFALIFGISHPFLHSIASICLFSMLFLGFPHLPNNRLGGDSLFPFLSFSFGFSPLFSMF